MNRPSRRSRGSVTIQDVAQAAGVSAMTVSRVINGGTNVRDTTRAAVLEAVEQLRYSPNAAARSLAAGEATHIGLLYANPSAAYLSQFLVGALDGARRAGCHLVIEPCESDDPTEQAEATRRFASTEVEGVILPPPLSESAPVLGALAEAGIPVVTVAMGVPRPESLNVRIDDYAAALEMTRHLLEFGHRHIGFIRGHPNHVASGDRYRGFAAALAEYGLSAAAMPVEQGYFTYRSGLDAAARILTGPNLPTAIFASNDDMAAAAVSVAHRQGLNIPGDISIVGYDDTALATSIWPELTTIRQPIAAMAETALDLLLTSLRMRRNGVCAIERQPILAHELIVRESSGVADRSMAARGRSAWKVETFASS